MRTLFLHVGHGKTGSSWIQAAMRLGATSLAAAGVAYARGEDDGILDSPLRITSGNGRGLLTSSETLLTRLSKDANDAGSNSLLYSSEYLFNEVITGDGLSKLIDYSRSLGFSNVSCLLFIRDPLGHASSHWQQHVKRRGITDGLEKYFSSFDVPSKVTAFIDILDAARIDLTIRNYSSCRDRLLVEVASWLGVPIETLPVPPGQRVNRSLSRAELMMQQELNRIFGSRASLIADRLCEDLPDITPDDIRPSTEIQAATWTRLLPSIEKVNARVPEGHCYRRDILTNEFNLDSEDVLLSRAQIAAAATGIGELVARELKWKTRFTDELKRPEAIEVMLSTRKLSGALFKRLALALLHKLRI